MAASAATAADAVDGATAKALPDEAGSTTLPGEATDDYGMVNGYLNQSLTITALAERTMEMVIGAGGERSARCACFQGPARHVPGDRSPSRCVPIATRTRRSVGRPTAAVMRRT